MRIELPRGERLVGRVLNKIDGKVMPGATVTWKPPQGDNPNHWPNGTLLATAAHTDQKAAFN